MANKLPYLNARGLRDLSKEARLLRDLLSFGVDVAGIQETPFARSMRVCFLETLLSIQHKGTGWPEEFPCW